MSEESVIAWQKYRAKQIEAELNRGSGPMWTTPFYSTLDADEIEANRKLINKNHA